MADIEIYHGDVRQLGFGNHSLVSGVQGEVFESSDSNAMTNNVYGINHRQTPLAIPMNKDHFGLTFFTRPQLNMQTNNLRNLRIMHPLLSQEPLSYHRMIRCLLDPRMMTGYGDSTENNDGAVNGITCPLVDNNMAFIPVLTNSLTAISGWPDIKVPTFTSREGPYKEGYSLVDGLTVDYSTYNLTANFRNSRGDPITSLFYYWTHYSSNVFEGTMSPYPDFITENEVDYNTRIYRLILDPSKRKVQRIAACGAAFPIAVPMGGIFDFSDEKPYNDVNASISIPFQAMGFICQDDILIRAFNLTVGIFNKQMRAESRDSNMVKIPFEHLNFFNNRGYPFIEPNTRELQWFINKDYYDAKIEALRNLDRALDSALGFDLSAPSENENIGESA